MIKFIVIVSILGMLGFSLWAIGDIYDRNTKLGYYETNLAKNANYNDYWSGR